MEASVTVTKTREAKRAWSLSGTHQTHTAMRQKGLTGPVPKVGEGKGRCGSGGEDEG